MDYQVLARKWRPKTFDEVIGQQHVAQTLTNAISQGRIAHAYLFSGSRGVGKTTMARILARALNCQTGPTPKPCQTCQACQFITSGHSTDVIEIDGASNRGIDEVRELREAIKYMPMQGRYRVYIIDEVHMLTKEAFNALLKTLEEPPAHAVFIMATTEAHKIPPTILSRCQHFQFRRITRQEITNQLKQVAVKEGMEITPTGTATLAKMADGSLRDALSLLDQAVAYSGKAVTDTDLQTMLGTPNRDILASMVKALIHRQTAEALSLIKTVLDQGHDLRQFVGELVEHWRNLLVAKVAREPADLIDLPPEEVTILSQVAATVSEEELQRLFGIFTQTLEVLRTATYPRFSLEMAVVRATQLPTLQSIEQLLKRLEDVERDLSIKAPKSDASIKTSSPDSTPEDPPVIQNAVVDQEPASLDAKARWEDVIRMIREDKPSLASYLEQGVWINAGEDSITLGYPRNADFLIGFIKKEEHQKMIKAAIGKRFSAPVLLKPVLLEPQQEDHKPAAGSLKQKQSEQAVHSDPIVKEALDIFGGEVVEIQEPSGP